CPLSKTIFALFKMTNNDHRPEGFIRCMECGEILAQIHEENCSMACVHNEKY
ncbi:unnamed protein product, partial [Rotaria sp. Silwood1]